MIIISYFNCIGSSLFFQWSKVNESNVDSMVYSLSKQYLNLHFNRQLLIIFYFLCFVYATILFLYPYVVMDFLSDISLFWLSDVWYLFFANSLNLRVNVVLMCLYVYLKVIYHCSEFKCLIYETTAFSIRFVILLKIRSKILHEIFISDCVNENSAIG